MEISSSFVLTRREKEGEGVRRMMTSGPQLAVTGREGRAAPSWAAWRSQAAPDPWPVSVGMGLLDGWAGWGGGWSGLRLLVLVCGL